MRKKSDRKLKMKAIVCYSYIGNKRINGDVIDGDRIYSTDVWDKYSDSFFLAWIENMQNHYSQLCIHFLKIIEK
jgi:hypothetical protein